MNNPLQTEVANRLSLRQPQKQSLDILVGAFAGMMVTGSKRLR